MMRLSAPVGPGQPNRRADVQAVQTLLNGVVAQLAPFLPLAVDGHFDLATELMLRAFQKRFVKASEADGVVTATGATWRMLNAHAAPPPPKHGAKTLGPADFVAAARKLECEVAAIRAVAETETKRRAFDAKGKATVLFERHKFSRFTGGRYDLTNPDLSNATPGGYGAAGRQYDRFEQAALLDDKAAKMSASWGMFQIMGFNYRAAGYRSIDEFVAAMNRSPHDQLNAFVRFVRSDPVLVRALQQKDWAVFAARYNGPEYEKNSYDLNIKAAYVRLASDQPPPPPQKRLGS